jgi:hypothetical protein
LEGSRVCQKPLLTRATHLQVLCNSQVTPQSQIGYRIRDVIRASTDNLGILKAYVPKKNTKLTHGYFMHVRKIATFLHLLFDVGIIFEMYETSFFHC